MADINISQPIHRFIVKTDDKYLNLIINSCLLRIHKLNDELFLTFSIPSDFSEILNKHIQDLEFSLTIDKCLEILNDYSGKLSIINLDETGYPIENFDFIINKISVSDNLYDYTIFIDTPLKYNVLAIAEILIKRTL